MQPMNAPPTTKEPMPTAADGQTVSGEGLMARYINLVKLPHTVFALPFALVGVVYASFGHGVSARQVLLVAVAFSAARFAAMGFNRIADRGFDGANPRTRGRELPTGKLTVSQAWMGVAAASAVFVGAAGLLNPLCLILSPIALAWIFAYSLTKRFTNWTHLWLGGSLAIAPVAGYLAVVGGWSSPWWTLLVVAGAVASWVAGFDILYALQDESFDREAGLESAVVRLGPVASIHLARALHASTIVLLAAFGMTTPFRSVYFAGVVTAAAILVWEHRLVRPGDLSNLDAAFFRMNGIMSVVVFLFALGDRLA